MDYKKYSLEQLENWMHDALSCTEASPQEIYDIIKNVVSENYYIYKDHTRRCYELLSLLNNDGNTSDMPWVENKLTCDKNNLSPECQNAWNDFWEEHYYPEEHSKYYYDYTRNDPNRKNPFEKKKWVLPVEPDPSGEYFVTFPDDLLEAADLKEGDSIEWVDQGDGSYLLHKISKNSD
jgi:hypothetical protein